MTERLTDDQEIDMKRELILGGFYSAAKFIDDLQAEITALRADNASLAASLQGEAQYAEELRGVLAKAVTALTEAEAILGGEYGDHYGPLAETMAGLRADIAAIEPKP